MPSKHSVPIEQSVPRAHSEQSVQSDLVILCHMTFRVSIRHNTRRNGEPAYLTQSVLALEVPRLAREVPPPPKNFAGRLPAATASEQETGHPDLVWVRCLADGP